MASREKTSSMILESQSVIFPSVNHRKSSKIMEDHGKISSDGDFTAIFLIRLSSPGRFAPRTTQPPPSHGPSGPNDLWNGPVAGCHPSSIPVKLEEISGKSMDNFWKYLWKSYGNVSWPCDNVHSLAFFPAWPDSSSANPTVEHVMGWVQVINSPKKDQNVQFSLVFSLLLKWQTHDSEKTELLTCSSFVLQQGALEFNLQAPSGTGGMEPPFSQTQAFSLCDFWAPGICFPIDRCPLAI